TPSWRWRTSSGGNSAGSAATSPGRMGTTGRPWTWSAGPRRRPTPCTPTCCTGWGCSRASRGGWTRRPTCCAAPWRSTAPRPGGEEGAPALAPLLDLAQGAAARGQDGVAREGFHRVLSAQAELLASYACLPPGPGRDGLLSAPWRLTEALLTLAVRHAGSVTN